MDSANHIETRLVWDFFKKSPQGVFVEVGANHPVMLCEQRPRSRAIHAAVGAPGQGDEVDLLLGMDHLHSTLTPVLGDPLSGKKVRVKLRTLDSILAEAGTTKIDFLSIDVEGMELQVLQGLDFKKYKPALILLEEHRRDYKKHYYLRSQGYRLVKRTGRNNWYVPGDSPATVGSLNTSGEALRMWRKMWLNPPFDKLKRKIKGVLPGGK